MPGSVTSRRGEEPFWKFAPADQLPCGGWRSRTGRDDRFACGVEFTSPGMRSRLRGGRYRTTSARSKARPRTTRVWARREIRSLMSNARCRAGPEILTAAQGFACCTEAGPLQVRFKSNRAWGSDTLIAKVPVL